MRRALAALAATCALLFGLTATPATAVAGTTVQHVWTDRAYESKLALRLTLMNGTTVLQSLGQERVNVRRVCPYTSTHTLRYQYGTTGAWHYAPVGECIAPGRAGLYRVTQFKFLWV